ncbi:thioredoxin family protein [Cellulomonas sp. P24]|uniref:thioredoxin family protein n=1 Tax=Cellulomonas sp. P24 TaxID=2885206 RepID=UPI00216B2A89|nr:thioredoxin family protein [Cellulomonas sp. P24]MCR6492410.1 thioredoxin family protein [Cellulomonas sp. P24]
MQTRIELLLAVLVLAGALGWWWSWRNGRFTAVSERVAAVAHESDDVPSAASPQVTPAELGVAPGARATFVQLSSEVCAPCRRTAVVLSSVAADHPGVVHVELDVEEHLELVRRFHVLRTPTVLVLGPDGTVCGRMSGAVSHHHAIASLESLGQCPDGARAH